jgi:murein L,D-transpeptidase YcbB/YkuD
MRAFQEQSGLPITGAADRTTLEALGVQAGE